MDIMNKAELGFSPVSLERDQQKNTEFHLVKNILTRVPELSLERQAEEATRSKTPMSRAAIEKMLRVIPDAEEHATLEHFDASESWADLIDKPDPINPEELSADRQLNLVPFGEGHGHTLFVDRERKKIVKIDSIPFDRNVPEDDYQLQERAFVQRIYATLFPDHIPNLDDSFSTGKQSGVVVDLIEKHPDLQSTIEKAEAGDASDFRRITTKPFAEMIEATQRAGIPFDADYKPDNYITDPQGRQFYIDDINITSQDLTEDPTVETNIRKFIVEKAYSEEDRKRVNVNLGALRTLRLEKEASKQQVA